VTPPWLKNGIVIGVDKENISIPKLAVRLSRCSQKPAGCQQNDEERDKVSRPALRTHPRLF